MSRLWRFNSESSSQTLQKIKSLFGAGSDKGTPRSHNQHTFARTLSVNYLNVFWHFDGKDWTLQLLAVLLIAVKVSINYRVLKILLNMAAKISFSKPLRGIRDVKEPKA